MKHKYVPTAAAGILAMTLLTACRSSREYHNPIYITLISNEGYTLAEGYTPRTEVTPGEEMRYVLYPNEGYVISGTDYPGGRISEGSSGSKILILPDVRYPTRVNVQCEKDSNVRTILYDANGGAAPDGRTDDTIHHLLNGHLFPNTDQGAFEKEASTLLCWNTQPDGSGTSIGLGSRCPKQDDLTLYAQWASWSDESLFQFQFENNGYTLQRYLGAESNVVIPNTYHNYPVKRIAAQSFENCSIQCLSLPRNLEAVEDGAFVHCEIEQLYFYDTMERISDSSFSDTPLPTVHINAAQPPRYAGSGRMSTYADKIDLLRINEDRKKIVIFGGSGAYYSVLAEKMQELLNDEYDVLNMGMNGWFPAGPQLEVIRQYMHEGDVLLHIPEESSRTQLFASTAFSQNVDAPDVFDDRYMRSLELNYDLITGMDLNNCQGFFDSFSRFNAARQDQPFTEYSDYSHYINENGDYPGKKLAYQADEAITHEAEICPELLTSEALDRLNQMYASFTERGVRVAVAYAAVNESALQETPDYLEKAAEFDLILRQQVEGAVVIEEIQDSFYPGSLFYNSDWHLSEDADVQNTLVIANGLIAWLRE